jgi:anthranilate synthase/aminodeoxychorismate synthase-like glutamine amidotransferase
MRVLVIDNYDSFTYNLVQYLGELGVDPLVQRNDALTVKQVADFEPDAIVLSPGPCTPSQAGITVPLIQEWGAKYPILGVCLGHQAIGEAYGGKVVPAREVMHGKTSLIDHSGEGIFRGIPSPLRVMRYHSLVIQPATLPSDLDVIARARDDQSEIHAVKHRENDVWGVQFHPESILTEHGKQILRNFLDLSGA